MNIHAEIIFVSFQTWFHAEIKLFYDGRPTAAGLKFFKIISERELTHVHVR